MQTLSLLPIAIIVLVLVVLLSIKEPLAVGRHPG